MTREQLEQEIRRQRMRATHRSWLEEVRSLAERNDPDALDPIDAEVAAVVEGRLAAEDVPMATWDELVAVAASADGNDDAAAVDAAQRLLDSQ